MPIRARLAVATAVTAALCAARVSAHPGAVAEGRATCGAEYSTEETAYRIPDIREAWYLRRVATCSEPYFYSTWETQTADQSVTIAANHPDIARLNANVLFKGVLTGPGLPAEGVAMDSPSGNGLNKCDFMKSNIVMIQYAKVENGLCKEIFPFDADYKNKLLAGATDRKVWLYTHNFKLAQVGRYHLKTWLVDRTGGTDLPVAGKYELTLGPRTWNKYASDETVALAQDQGTACSCGVNAWAYYEQNLDRLGDLPAAVFEAWLPFKTCAADPTTPLEEHHDVCGTRTVEPLLTDDSAVEWYGTFDLTGKTKTKQTPTSATWTFRRVGAEYPDPAIDVVLGGAGLTAAEANQIMSAPEFKEVQAGETLSLSSTVKQRLFFANASKTSFPFGPGSVTGGPSGSGAQTQQPKTDLTNSGSGAADITTIVMYTQHHPAEFVSEYLELTDGSFVFPASRKDFVEGATFAPTPPPTAKPSSAPTPLPTAPTAPTAVPSSAPTPLPTARPTPGQADRDAVVAKHSAAKDAIVAATASGLTKQSTVKADSTPAEVLAALNAAVTEASLLAGLTVEDVAAFDGDGDGKLSASEIAAAAAAVGLDGTVTASTDSDVGSAASSGVSSSVAAAAMSVVAAAVLC